MLYKMMSKGCERLAVFTNYLCMLKYSLGIDMSKNLFHACLSFIDALQQVKVIRSVTLANNTTGFKQLLKWIDCCCKQKDIKLTVVMEATGVYYENCALFLHKNGLAVSVVLPNKSKKYIAAVGIKTKNDKTDAKALSRMGAEQALQVWQPLQGFFYELRLLTRHNQALKDLRCSLNNQLEAASHGMHQNKEVIKSLGSIMRSVDKQIRDNTKSISKHISSDKIIAEKIKHITAVKGLAELSVAVVLAETNGFALFENIPQLVSYAGYDVIENQSGRHTGKTKISKKGNGHIRRILHMPALNVVRYKEKVFKDLFDRTFSRHGIKMKSYVAVQKKLLTVIFSLWKKNERFDTNYSTKEVETVQSSRSASQKLNKKLALNEQG